MEEGSNITRIVTLSYSLQFLIFGTRKYEWQIMCKGAHTAKGIAENL